MHIHFYIYSYLKVCKQAVHALDSCSLPVSDTHERPEKQLVCTNCSENNNERSPVEPRSTVKPRGKYLQETYAAHEFLLTDDLPKVPILKSGNKTDLKPIRKGRQRIDLTNTCAFDSLFQLMLTTTFDCPIFYKNFIQSNIAVNKFIKMIYDVRNKKVTVATYRTRCSILCEHFEQKGHPEMACVLVDCQTTVSALFRKLLRNLPCFEETSVCKAKCPLLVKHFALLTVNLKSLTASSYNAKIEAEININDWTEKHQARQCSTDDCLGELNSTLKLTG